MTCLFFGNFLIKDIKMSKEFKARVVISLTEEFAKAVNKNGLQYTNSKALAPLKSVLSKHKADLHNALRDFEYYVESSEAHGVSDNPIINWTRDATNNPHATARYSVKFTLAVAGRKVFDRKFADNIAEDLKILIGNGPVKHVQVDSMDPSKNPPIPSRYFK